MIDLVLSIYLKRAYTYILLPLMSEFVYHSDKLSVCVPRYIPAECSAGQVPGGKVASGGKAASGSKVGRMYI
jgi:hypothetical protein